MSMRQVAMNCFPETGDAQALTSRSEPSRVSMVDLHDIRFTYRSGTFCLRIPALSIHTGEKLAVIGPSGSGKTTLLNLVAGILTPQKGSVTVDSIELNKQTDAARRAFRVNAIGFIFQDFGLLDYLDVRDNILHPYRITGALSLTREVRARAEMLAEQMGIADKLKRHPPELSHGERQRVAICRALVVEPKIILADEATGNLDPVNKRRIMELIFQCVTQTKATLLAVTHDRELLDSFDRVTDFQDWITA